MENKNIFTRLIDLRVNGRCHPLDVNAGSPVFSWKMESNVIGQVQTAYRIVVQKVQKVSPSVREVVWDSGKHPTNESSGIVYGSTGNAATALIPETGYHWSVWVWDREGKCVQAEAEFDTGLAGDDLDAWDGARWIGPPDLYLDAHSLVVYRIKYTLQIPVGSSRASIIFGANDFRLNHSAMNEYRMACENYIRYEVDISDVCETGGAKVNVFRVGHAPGDNAEIPYKVISAATVNDCNIDQIITHGNKHELHRIELVCESSKVTMYMDGTAISVGVTEGSSMLAPEASLPLNPRGVDDVQAYPLLNDVGFAAEAGETAIFTNFEITHFREPQATVFGKDIGATYSIFEGIKGVDIEGNTIVVNGGETGILFYRDPSYGAIPMLRTEFLAGQEIAKAKLYVTSRGIHEIYLNGTRVGDEYFHPGSDEYSKSICYVAYDVTADIALGGNAIGVYLASGWWSDMMSFSKTNTNYFGDRQSLLLKLAITYKDGHVRNIISDPSTWKYDNRGPIKYAGFFQGEKYDARDEEAVQGWSEPGFDDRNWSQPAVITPLHRFASPRIVPKPDTGVKVFEVLKAAYLGEFREGSGTYLYDMGVNMVGVPRITLKGKVGQQIIIRTAEMLYPDLQVYRELDIEGNLMVENLREALSTDFYICKDGIQTIRPRFTYHGYRYLEISGTDGPLAAENVEGLVLSSVEKMSGSFESSNPFINQLFRNIQRSHLGNFMSIPTDCPQRNERMGWGQDVAGFAHTANYNSCDANFYKNFMRILTHSQVTQELVDSPANGIGSGHSVAGMFPSYAPAYQASRSWGTPWSCAAVIVSWEVYRHYGCKDIISENYAAMVTYMEAMERLVLPGCQYLAADGGVCGDWLALDKPPYQYTDASVYVYMLGCMSRMSDIIGEQSRARHYNELFVHAKEEWNRSYVNAKTGRLNAKATESQSSYTIGLYFDLFYEEYKHVASSILAEKVKAGYNGVSYAITTGLFTTPLINLALSRYGHSETAYRMIENTRFPSWLHSVTQGATSMWERWDSYTEEQGFGGNNNMNSFNHFSNGGVGAWLYNTVLGIERDESVPGMQHFILQPTIGGTLTFAQGKCETVYGMIHSGWKANPDGALIRYGATIPANTSATVYLPIPADTEVQIAGDVEVVNFIGMVHHNGNPAAKFKVAAGNYIFEMTGTRLFVSAK